MSASYILSVRNGLGVGVGTADALSADGVSFEMAHPLGVGERAEFRMELPRADETVLGTLVVVAGEGPPGSLIRYRARIEAVDPRDAQTFAGWLDRAREGRPADDLRRRLLDRDSLSSMHGATESETQNALRRIEERKARMDALRSAESDDEGLFVVDLFAMQPVGSAPPARPSPAPRPASAAPKPVAVGPPVPAAPPPAPPPAAAPPPGPPTGPWVTLQHLRGVAILVVAWVDPATVRPETRDDVRRGWVWLDEGVLPRWPERCRLHLLTPSGFEVEHEAVLRERREGRVGYQMEAPESALRSIPRELG